MNQDSETRRRLELMRLIREENHSNLRRIRAREEILYGKSNSYNYAQEEGYDEYDNYGYPLRAAEYTGPQETARFSPFGLRFLLACILFAIYYFCRIQDLTVGGIEPSQIEAAVEGQNSKVLELISRYL